jgi:hypothetical protein
MIKEMSPKRDVSRLNEMFLIAFLSSMMIALAPRLSGFAARFSVIRGEFVHAPAPAARTRKFDKFDISGSLLIESPGYLPRISSPSLFRPLSLLAKCGGINYRFNDPVLNRKCRFILRLICISHGNYIQRRRTAKAVPLTVFRNDIATSRECPKVVSHEL